MAEIKMLSLLLFAINSTTNNNNENHGGEDKKAEILNNLAEILVA